MKKLFVLCSLLMGTLCFAQRSQIIKDYIETYREIAIQEMIRTGVPASITLAQGIHETSAGQSVLVTKSNNHFGIKCKSDWKGESVSHDDDAKGECFRKYDDPFESYKDHSDFLKYRAHYAFLFKLDPTDYEGWAYGLKKAGYATNPKYPQVLIKLIKDYNLQEYTLLAIERIKTNPDGVLVDNAANISNESAFPAKSPDIVPALSATYPTGKFTINETNVIVITKGTSYLKIAQENNISISRLFDFNDMKPADLAEIDHLLFLQRKRKTGSKELHVVQPGEDLQLIAQINGLRLENLLEYNGLTATQVPAAGTKLYLMGPAPATTQSATTVAQEKPSGNPYSEGNYLIFHTVQVKETLFAISKKYEVTVDDILLWNDLNASDLKPGQQLKIYKKK
ncbi:MAG: LysM peptidoglycan-binding domain-containing protein [Flavisolibacter sp.]|jgi:LysM repeat protein|nr:LysM peptidoglycan-binding domain-containing protein [Flavisolibacter sp.]